ncbi:unnamed protein product, partial [Amoebophrya sp. A25]
SNGNDLPCFIHVKVDNRTWCSRATVVFLFFVTDGLHGVASSAESCETKPARCPGDIGHEISTIVRRCVLATFVTISFRRSVFSASRVAETEFGGFGSSQSLSCTLCSGVLLLCVVVYSPAARKQLDGDATRREKSALHGVVLSGSDRWDHFCRRQYNSDGWCCKATRSDRCLLCTFHMRDCRFGRSFSIC